jgi:mycothiol synthase
MLERILAGTTGDLLVWAHGDHPAARALAASHGLLPVRTLLQLELRRIEPVETAPTDDDGDASARSTRFAAFRVGADESAWVALNARIFAFHAEQGSVTLDDLDELESEDWFDPEDFLLAWAGDELVGYCWLKVEHGEGEIYVIGVAPEQQGTGLGRALMAAGYARLAARGIGSVHLYVEGDNEKALALYRSLGFTDRSVDIQYELARAE